MKSMNWKDIAELIGIVAIVASLIFVGLELQQSRKIAIADVYQQRTAMNIDLINSRFTPEQIRPIFDKALLGNEPLTPRETYLRNYSLIPFIVYWENNHFQFELGLLPEEQWKSSKEAMRGMAMNSGFDKWWSENKSGYRKSFVREFDEVMAEEARRSK